MIDQRPWDTERALRVVLFEYYQDAPDSFADRDCARYVEGLTKHQPKGKSRYGNQ